MENRTQLTPRPQFVPLRIRRSCFSRKTFLADDEAGCAPDDGQLLIAGSKKGFRESAGMRDFPIDHAGLAGAVGCCDAAVNLGDESGPLFVAEFE